MSNGSGSRSKKIKWPIWLIAVLCAIFIFAGVFSFAREDDTSAVQNNQTYALTDNPEQTVPQNNMGTDETIMPEETERATDDSQSATQMQSEQKVETEPVVEIIQRVDAEYEKWLSAAMLVCVSMEYPDFQLEGIYTTSSTALEEKYNSDGVCIVFTSADTLIAICSKALEEERTEASTVDISTEVIGYATFDKVDPESIDYRSMEKINVEALGELITQSLLVSIYSR